MQVESMSRRNGNASWRYTSVAAKMIFYDKTPVLPCPFATIDIKLLALEISFYSIHRSKVFFIFITMWMFQIFFYSNDHFVLFREYGCVSTVTALLHVKLWSPSMEFDNLGIGDFLGCFSLYFILFYFFFETILWDGFVNE